ncbi:serine hydrolase [Streptosporangium lutulentum]
MPMVVNAGRPPRPMEGVVPTGHAERTETGNIHETSRLATTLAHDNHVPDDVDVRLTGLLENLVARRDVHHANLAVASGDGKRRWSAASGPAGSDDHQPRPDTPFFIASVTKRFIITLVLQAHERGELELAAPIGAYLPRRRSPGSMSSGDRPDVRDHGAPPRESYVRVA